MRSSTPPVVAAGTMADRTQPTLLVDDALQLRPFGSGDVNAVINAYADPDITHWHSHLVDTEDEALVWIDSTRRGWAHESAANWAVVDRRTDTVLGRCGLATRLGDGFGEITYWVLPESRGARIAARAAAAIADWAFSDLGLHRLEIEHSTQNPASCRVATQVGFEAEGVRRSARLHPDGWHDMHIHACIAPD